MLQEKGVKMWLMMKVVVLPIVKPGPRVGIGLLEPEFKALFRQAWDWGGMTSSSETPESSVLSSAIMVAN